MWLGFVVCFFGFKGLWIIWDCGFVEQIIHPVTAWLCHRWSFWNKTPRHNDTSRALYVNTQHNTTHTSSQRPTAAAL